MIKNVLILSLLFVAVGQAKCDEKKDKNSAVIIQGEQQALEISDLSLPQYKYDDLNFFAKNFQPEKELLSLLDKPDVLMELDNKTVALDFDGQNSER